MPHGRSLRYWAKASLFRIPFIKQILDSSGALPVHRRRHIRSHPPSPTGRGRNKDNIHDTLFEETVVALSRGETIGVFPEGTSYTHPHVPPLRPGAARVALEFAGRQAGKEKEESRSKRVPETRRWIRDDHRQLKIIPVSLVYTDKLEYRSRVRCCPALVRISSISIVSVTF